MADIALNWLRREAIVGTYQQNTTSNVTVQVFPADPMRFMLTVRPHPTVDIFIGFGNNPNVQMSFMIPHASNSIVFSEDQFGDLVGLPLWGYTAGSNGYIMGFSCSYCPCKWGSYERIAKHSLGL